MGFSYLLFWKPYGVLTQFTDQEGRSTLKDYIDQPGVYPVGRLDQDSEGLLLLTDDGPLSHRLTDPRFDHPKTYWAQVEGIPDPQAIQALSKGVTIQNYQTRPAHIRALDQEPNLPLRDVPIRFRKAIPTSWIELILTEGKNRQVRRMTAAVGFPTLRLVRVEMGELTLECLAPGTYRLLTNQEVQVLKKRRY